MELSLLQLCFSCFGKPKCLPSKRSTENYCWHRCHKHTALETWLLLAAGLLWLTTIRFPNSLELNTLVVIISSQVWLSTGLVERMPAGTVSSPGGRGNTYPRGNRLWHQRSPSSECPSIHFCFTSVSFIICSPSLPPSSAGFFLGCWVGFPQLFQLFHHHLEIVTR